MHATIGLLARQCRLVLQNVDAIFKWSHDNGIIINADKTQYNIKLIPYLPVKENPIPLYAHTFYGIRDNLVNGSCEPIQRVKCVT